MDATAEPGSGDCGSGLWMRDAPTMYETTANTATAASITDPATAGIGTMMGMSAPITQSNWNRVSKRANERPRFATSVLQNIVNWEFVGENLDGRGFDRANQEGARLTEPTA